MDIKVAAKSIMAATIFALSIALPYKAAASNAGAGYISGILIDQGYVFFYVSGAHSAGPSCATQTGRWVFNGATPAGQAMMSGLMSFYAENKQVWVQGTGACTDWNDTESVTYIQLAN